jgi:hypothetical protein
MVKIFKHGMSYLNLITTYTANNMMVIITCNLVSQMSITGLRGARKTVLRKEIERTVDSGLRETG